jgi:MauM/NapG family ferredoxin protein
MDSNISRKDFFKEAFGFFKGHFSGGHKPSVQVEKGYILPPGTVSLSHYLKHCDQCFECISACPHLALQVVREDGHILEGYPVIEPRRQPCYLCEDFPCIAACHTDALQMSLKEKPLGVARIEPQLCLAYQGHFCQACVTNCPLSGKAIRFNNQARPEVIEENCTGCGVCVFACPTETPAIQVEMKTE